MKHIGIVGAGTMGAGIAQAAALAELEVTLYDINTTVLRQSTEKIRTELKQGIQKGKIPPEKLDPTLERIKPRTSISDLSSCDLILEAVIEDLRVKRDLFKRIEENAKSEALLASNTSSLSITAIASSLHRPGRFLGIHFFNPANIMKLVEVVRGRQTSDEVVGQGAAFAKRLGKTPVVVKDTPGFIVNRLARPFYGEALRLLGEHVATVEQIDRIVKTSGDFAMGPFELMDLIGIDINLAVTQSIYDQYFGEPRFRPHPLQQEMVDAGWLGRKSGRGFYNYSESKNQQASGTRKPT